MAVVEGVDISHGLTLWASFPTSLLPRLDAVQALAPEHVMKSDENCAWVLLWTEQKDAVDRVPDMYGELGLEFTDSAEVSVVKVTFTCLGFGHYYLMRTLTTRDWRHWRFHGTLQYVQMNHTGQEILRIDPDVLGVVPMSDF